MKRILFAFMFLFFINLTFAAQWQDLTLIAIIASIFALAIVFSIGYAIESQELKFLAREELAQLFITGIMVAGFATIVEPLFSTIHVDSSAAISQTISNITMIHGELYSTSLAIGKEASRSIWCSFSAASFGLSTCSGYRMLAPPLSSAFQLTATALSELQALELLINFSKNQIFTLFFPFGLFLRTFKYTRGAGSLFISVGLALYIVLPLSFVFIHKVVSQQAPQLPNALASNVKECNVYRIHGSGNEQKAITTFTNIMNSNVIRPLLFYTLIDATLTTIISLAITVISIRYISSIAGAEVDTHALARLM